MTQPSTRRQPYPITVDGELPDVCVSRLADLFLDIEDRMIADGRLVEVDDGEGEVLIITREEARARETDVEAGPAGWRPGEDGRNSSSKTVGPGVEQTPPGRTERIW